jgi:hypothetical protein
MSDSIRFQFSGVAPLIQHSSRLADPLEDATKKLKAVTSKKKKTEDDLEVMSRLEWEGGLILSPAGRVALSSTQIEAMIYEAARATRTGKDAQRSVYVEHFAEIEYKGCKPGALNLDKAWASRGHVLRVPARVQQARVMRTRPIFYDWSAVVDVTYERDTFDRAALIDVVKTAGAKVGIGDWRPRYGRFAVEVLS